MAIAVFVTIPKNEALAFAKKVLKTRLCACVNIIPSISSYYWWKNKLEKGAESLLIIKTQDKLFAKLKREIRKLHPYDVPEIVGFKINKINKEYLKWLLKETKGG